MKSSTIATIAMPNAKDITELRQRLLACFNGLCNGTLEPKEAVEINNTAGKIIGSAKAQLEYHAMRGERPEIEFLAGAPTTKVIEQEKQAQLGSASRAPGA